MAYRLLSRLQNCIYQSTGGPSRAVHLSACSQKIVQFLLSDIGEGIREVTVKDWFVKDGDAVRQFDDICLVESDKASVNITSRYDGTVKKLYYEIGDVALVGKPLVDIDTECDDSSTSSSDEDETSPTISPLDSVKDSPSETEDIYKNKALATPAVRRIAKQYNILIKDIKGTGKSGRVLKEDILKLVNEESQDARTVVPTTESGDSLGDVVPITGVKKVMVNTMTRSGAIPTFGYCDEIDLTKLVNLRTDINKNAQEKGINITYTAFFVKAMSKALEKYPILNATVDEKCENIHYKKVHNIGVAMDTPSGLIVPNIKDVQSLNIIQIAKELNRLLEAGRKGGLRPADLTGGTISISNIGVIGGTYARPLVLPPEVAIVALGKTQVKPVFNDAGTVVKAHIMNVSWAADHRILDGATVARFSNVWKLYIENPAVLIMDL